MRFGKWMMAGALASLLPATGAMAAFDLQITEAFVGGIPGPDGTVDWIEISNLGDMSVDLDGFFYDDESADIGAGGALPSFTLGAGASVVVLVDIDAGETANEIAAFASVWGTGIDVIGIEGGGSLGGSGDAAVLLDSFGSPVDVLITTAEQSGLSSTITDIDGDGTTFNAVLGVEGAFASQSFENDNFPGGLVLIGSPGVVPEPASAVLVGLGGLAMLRRRR